LALWDPKAKGPLQILPTNGFEPEPLALALKGFSPRQAGTGKVNPKANGKWFFETQPGGSRFAFATLLMGQNKRAGNGSNYFADFALAKVFRVRLHHIKGQSLFLSPL